MKVKYVSKKKLYPAFGIALHKGERIYIRKDLPKLIQKYLYWHESFHIIDYKRLKRKKQIIFWADTKASVYGFVKQPIGAIMTLFLSLKNILLGKSGYFNHKKKGDKIVKRLERI